MRLVTAALLFAGLLMPSSGCAPAKKAPPDKIDAAASKSKTARPAEPSITPVKVADYDKVIAQHKGKVVVADFWFKGCVPCEASMPHLSKLQAKHPDTLAVLVFDHDEPGEARERAIAFLKEKKFNFANYLIDDKETEEAWDKAFMAKNMPLETFPTTFIYDKDGKLVKYLQGKDLEAVDTTVAKLLDGEQLPAVDLGKDKKEISSGKGHDVVAEQIKVADFDAVIKKHKGKVVVADFWFRFCGPCVAAMPHLAELQTKHPEDLVVVTFAIDEPGKKREEAVTFLQKERYPFATYVIHDKESEEDWIKKFDLVAFPTTLIFDRTGAMAKRFEGGEEGDKLLKSIGQELTRNSKK